MSRDQRRFMFALLGLAGFALGTHVLMAQVESSPAAIQAADNSSSGAAAAVTIAEFLTSVKVSGFISWGIMLMKNSELKALGWITTKTPWAARLISLLAAALTASGIDYVWKPAADGSHSLIISGITLVAIVHAVWHTAQNYLVQKAWYKTTFGGGTSEVKVEPGGVAIAPAPKGA
jgi:hypothetical protein